MPPLCPSNHSSRRLSSSWWYLWSSQPFAIYGSWTWLMKIKMWKAWMCICSIFKFRIANIISFLCFVWVNLETTRGGQDESGRFVQPPSLSPRVYHTGRPLSGVSTGLGAPVERGGLTLARYLASHWLTYITHTHTHTHTWWKFRNVTYAAFIHGKAVGTVTFETGILSRCWLEYMTPWWICKMWSQTFWLSTDTRW